MLYKRNPQLNKNGELIHLLSIEGLPRDIIHHILDTAGTDATKLPFAIDGSHILLIDDVLYTGRTIRAVINELYDFGRPASVRLAVLVDRGGRELPVAADFAATQFTLPAGQLLALARGDSGAFSLKVEESK